MSLNGSKIYPPSSNSRCATPSSVSLVFSRYLPQKKPVISLFHVQIAILASYIQILLGFYGMVNESTAQCTVSESFITRVAQNGSEENIRYSKNFLCDWIYPKPIFLLEELVNKVSVLYKLATNPLETDFPDYLLQCDPRQQKAKQGYMQL